MEQIRLKKDVVEEFTTAAWQNDVNIIDNLAATFPFLVDKSEPHLLDALHTACNSCQSDAARLLVEKYGADVNAIADPARGMTALHEAINSRDLVIVRMLVKNGANVNACMGGSDPECAGMTPLQLASPNREIERFLVSKGARNAPPAPKKQGGPSL